MSNLLSELDAQSKWLRKVAAEIAEEGHNGWGNTCLQAADVIDTHHAEIAAAVRDAARWRYVVGNSEWIRDEEDTLMAVRFEYSHPNLESIGMRTYAIDAAMSAREGE